MRKKEFKELFGHSTNIYNFLNGDYNPIGEFLEIGSKVFDRVFNSKKGDRDDVAHAVFETWQAAFGLGYVIGNEVNLIDSEILKDVAMIKKIIRKEELLPYLPREKKKGKSGYKHISTHRYNEDGGRIDEGRML